MIEILNKYIEQPNNAKNNLLLGLEYFSLKHYAEAVSFFLRAAENSEGDIKYEALIYLYLCYRELGGRGFTLNSILKHTIAKFSNRPEVYYHLSKLCEADNANMDGYMYASLGLQHIDNKSKIIGDLEYRGPHDLYFLKAHFAWLVDKPSEARQTYQYILKNYLFDLHNDQKKFLRSQLLRLGMAKESETIKTYSKNNPSVWPYYFDGKDSIDKNFSQILQDMFVLYSLNGKRNGTYLEVGSAFPYHTNNTALLETQFDWTGVGLDNNPEFVKNYNDHRKNKSILTDALLIDYGKLLQKYFPNQTNIDYLQLDIQTSEETYNALESIPFDKYKFAVITYEHDDYVDTDQLYKNKSREFLFSKGYYLAVRDVAPVDGFSFEDWWVHPDLVDMNRIYYLNNKLADINWGSLPEIDIVTIHREIVEEDVYGFWKQVKDNDIVVDIGCSVGPFSCSIMNKKLKHLYCVEPSHELIQVAQNNIANKNLLNNSITYINNAIIKDEKSLVNIFGSNPNFQGITFKQLIENYNIDYIDFLKIDCEGGEYDIFIDDNMQFLINNVMFIAAEFHLSYPGNRSRFKNFRDKYLPLFPNMKVISCSRQNIIEGEMLNLSTWIKDDNFIDNYSSQLMVYINNDRS